MVWENNGKQKVMSRDDFLNDWERAVSRHEEHRVVPSDWAVNKLEEIFSKHFGDSEPPKQVDGSDLYIDSIGRVLLRGYIVAILNTEGSTVALEEFKSILNADSAAYKEYIPLRDIERLMNKKEQ